MGKAARSERLKLTATFFNNIGIGIALAAVAIPYFNYMWSDQNLFELISHDMPRLAHVATAVIGALAISASLHQLARSILSDLSD